MGGRRVEGLSRSSTNNALRSVWPKWFLLDTRTICLLRRCEGERESSDERGKTKRKHASRERDVCVCVLCWIAVCSAEHAGAVFLTVERAVYSVRSGSGASYTQKAHPRALKLGCTSRAASRSHQINSDAELRFRIPAEHCISSHKGWDAAAPIRTNTNKTQTSASQTEVY